MIPLENAFYWYWFVNVPGVGSFTKKRLLSIYEHPRNLFEEKKEHIAALKKKNTTKCQGFLSEQQYENLLQSRNIEKIMQSKKQMEGTRTTFIHWEDEAYPERFRNIYDSPYGFYLRGRMPDFSQPALAMVGSRSATRYGMEMAGEFAAGLAEKGVQIISGLASGIDAASHRGALRGDGYTMGILGGGIDTVYPRSNFSLYMELYAKGGVISEYNLGIPNHPGLFPRRNRLISALSDGVFVLEARRKSGSLITADQGLEQGKDIFALPGRITDPLSAGCNNLIAQGAVLVQSPQEIYEILRGGNRIHSSEKGMGKKIIFEKKEEQVIFDFLDEIYPVSFEEILKKSGYPIPKLQHILFSLELQQKIIQTEQNVYLRSFL